MHVLLLFEHEKNRRLVADSLAGEFTVVEGKDDDLPDEPFDLCVFGPRMLQRHGEWIRERRAQEQPVLLPCLLVAPRGRLSLASGELWEVADDVVMTPVEKVELQARIRSLLRARTLSLSLRSRNEELEAARNTLMEQNERLEQLNDQKNQLLGMAAHDLRNPLGVISAYTDFLVEALDPSLSDTQRDFMNRIRSSSRFMLGMINDLLDLTAIESGRLRLDRVPMSPGALLRTNVDTNATLASQKEITLALEMDPDVPRLWLDPEKMEQVLNNLISNAVKFSHPGTTVRVGLHGTEAGARITVEDQGQGIPAEEIDRLFRPFGKASVRGTAGEKSTGLGLAIVKRIVNGHGGEIRVESEVGTGSTFFVDLPAGPPSDPEDLASDAP